MRCAITITARMKSKRLPLKALRLINRRPMIEQIIKRVMFAFNYDEIILCTSMKPEDDVLVDYAEKLGIKCYRGDDVDVLKRLHGAMKANRIDFIASITADNPLIDPVYIDETFRLWKETGADYITSYDLPLGCYCFGVSRAAMDRVIDEKKDKDTEIWGKYFEDSKFKIKRLKVRREHRKPKLRLTVDTKEDLDVVGIIYRNLQNFGYFGLDDILGFIKKNKRIMDLNKHVRQRR